MTKQLREAPEAAGFEPTRRFPPKQEPPAPKAEPKYKPEDRAALKARQEQGAARLSAARSAIGRIPVRGSDA